jgi:DNA-binding MarR family transcriptional regulator
MSKPATIALPCTCASLRRATRMLTQRYDEALRAADITITHFTILQALTLAGEVPQGRLGEILAMDSTTLTRTLEIMIRHGWVTTRPGTDRRQRWLSISKSGKTKFNQALPHWEGAQAELRAKLGEKRWNSLNTLIHQVTSAVAE